MEKINRELRKQIMEILQKEVDDPHLEFLSVTRVKTTADLQESRVYFSLLNEEYYPQAMATLERMKGFIRGRLGKKIRLKFLPKLLFFPDDSIKYSVDIYQKIEEIRKNDVRQGGEDHHSDTAQT